MRVEDGQDPATPDLGRDGLQQLGHRRGQGEERRRDEHQQQVLDHVHREQRRVVALDARSGARTGPRAARHARDRRRRGTGWLGMRPVDAAGRPRTTAAGRRAGSQASGSNDQPNAKLARSAASGRSGRGRGRRGAARARDGRDGDRERAARRGVRSARGPGRAAALHRALAPRDQLGRARLTALATRGVGYDRGPRPGTGGPRPRTASPAGPSRSRGRADVIRGVRCRSPPGSGRVRPLVAGC